jgi:hypothetical protein
LLLLALLFMPIAPVSAAPATVRSVRGLVVVDAADGQMHGKTIEIIAANSPAPQQKPSFKIVTKVGKEMSISFDEAVRLFKLKHPEFKGTIEVSFSDKYSPKEGGSAGAAFTMVLLSSAGDFEINPDAAMTGDITVDSKVRPVGAVAQKVRGAALDHCKLVVIPAANATAMDDAVLLEGVAALWQTQIFSADTIDDAIAVMRKDVSPQIFKAMTLFDELKASWGDKDAAALKTPEVAQKLAAILEAAPNHVSAKGLKLLADGKGPTRLSPQTTISESIVALGPMRDGLSTGNFNTSHATKEDLQNALNNLERVEKIADPSAAAVVAPIKAYCQSYAAWAEARTKKGAKKADYQPAEEDMKSRRGEVVSAMQKLVTDPEFIDKVIHP